VGAQEVERALGDRDLPEGRRMHVVGHHQVAGSEVAQVEHQRLRRGGRRLDGGVRLDDRGSGARAAEVERDGGGEDPLAALGEEGERRAVVALEGGAVPPREPRVVGADVEAAEVVARVLPRRGDLLGEHILHRRAVLRVRRVRQAEPAGDPQRPRLQRDAPLQLPAAVRDRVPEGEDAEAAG
jgi:hypothetical protein